MAVIVDFDRVSPAAIRNSIMPNWGKQLYLSNTFYKGDYNNKPHFGGVYYYFLSSGGNFLFSGGEFCSGGFC
jgi:hypothetical protein